MSIASIISRYAFPQCFSRTALVAATALGILAVPLHVTHAQESTSTQDQTERAWAIRFTSGALVPTGTQRNSFKDAQLSAAALSWRLSSSLAITGSFSWARSRVVDAVDRTKVDIFTSDLGMEVRTRELRSTHAINLRPFASAGGGVRTYNYRAAGIDATNHPAGFLAVGTDVGLGRAGVRLEVRDYVTRFAPQVGNATAEARNDVVMNVGLSLKKRRAPQS